MTHEVALQENTVPKSFGKIRNLIWPIHNFELKKLLPMFAMFFLIAFVYNLLHCLKVPIIVKAEGGGAEAIPFLQIVGILPAAMLLTYIYTRLTERFNREQIFYIFILGFLAYFALFLFVLYPNNQALRLDNLADFLQNNVFPWPGAKGLIATIRNLNLAIFYVLAEMWTVIVLFMLFWGFANEVTKIEEAKRFYAIFALGANCSGIIAGEFARNIKSLSIVVPVIDFYQGSEWLFFQLCTILILGAIIVFLFWWINRYIFVTEKSIDKPIALRSRKNQQSKPKVTILECISFLRKSRYITYMVFIVVGYYIVYNLADIMWAYKIGLVMDSTQEINEYMNGVMSVTGIIAVFFALILSGNVIRRFGWTATALITPFVWLITSIAFFAGIAFENSSMIEIFTTLMANPANLVLLIGSMQICLGRGCKYTVFDQTKEIAFIPLSREEQRKGKIIVDGLASRFGKSGGSIIYVMLLLIFGEMTNIIPYIAVIIFIALAAWLYATYKMGQIIDKATIST
jgi:AAA family ATP:ADP antiporter